MLRITVMVSSLLFIAGNVFFALNNADPRVHWDVFNYYSGYQKVALGLGIFSAYDNFGQMPEIMLPVFYFLQSKIWFIEDMKSLLILHSWLFSLIFPMSILFFLKILFNNNAVNVTISILLILFLVPPGLPLQTARQSIAFALFIFIYAILYKRPSLELWGEKPHNYFIMPFLHVGSSLTPIFVALMKAKHSPIALLALISGTMFIHAIGITIPGSDIFIEVDSSPFSNEVANLLMAIALVNFLAHAFVGQSIRGNLIFFVTCLAISINPLSFLFRLFFGLEFFLIPLGMLYFNIRNGSSIYGKFGKPICLLLFFAILVKFYLVQDYTSSYNAMMIDGVIYR